MSNWVISPTFAFTPSDTAPDQDPADGRLWYYSATDQADIMIQNNGQWCGYQTVGNDVRGYDLSLTNATGPIFSTTAPKTQSDGTTPLTEMMGKISIIVDRSNLAFLECKEFYEYVNMTSNSVFMRALRFNDVKFTHDMNELIDYNKKD